MVTDRGDEEPDIEPDALTLSVWTPTPEEEEISKALMDQLVRARSPKAIREAERRVKEYWREMQQRHRDDPPRAPVDPAALEAMRKRHMELLKQQLRDMDDNPPKPDPSTN